MVGNPNPTCREGSFDELPKCAFDISRMTALKVKNITVKVKGERQTPSIAGAEFLPDGRLLLTDIVNDKVKLLSSSLHYEDDVTIQMASDIAIVNATSVIVVSKETQLCFLRVVPVLQVESVISINRTSHERCFGIDVSDGTIYLSCHFLKHTELHGYIMLLDMDGTSRDTLGVIDAQNFDYMFKSPYHVRVSRVSGNIFVTDWYTNTITCLSTTGEIIYEFTNDNLQSTQHFILDDLDNILVCGSDSNTLEVVKNNGKDHKVFLTAADGLSYPGSVAYRPADGALIVGSCYSNDIILFNILFIK